MTAAKSKTPRKTRNKELSTPAKNKPCWTTPNMRAPSAAPMTLPYPPVKSAPPITTAMIASNSFNSPRSAPADPEFHNLARREDTHAQNAENMNIKIFTRLTGTPTYRAAWASPPDAKIQLPNRVRVKTKCPTMTRPMAQMIRAGIPSITGCPADYRVRRRRSGRGRLAR